MWLCSWPPLHCAYLHSWMIVTLKTDLKQTTESSQKMVLKQKTSLSVTEHREDKVRTYERKVELKDSATVREECSLKMETEFEKREEELSTWSSEIQHELVEETEPRDKPKPDQNIKPCDEEDTALGMKKEKSLSSGHPTRREDVVLPPKHDAPSPPERICLLRNEGSPPDAGVLSESALPSSEDFNQALKAEVPSVRASSMSSAQRVSPPTKQDTPKILPHRTAALPKTEHRPIQGKEAQRERDIEPLDKPSCLLEEVSLEEKPDPVHVPAQSPSPERTVCLEEESSPAEKTLLPGAVVVPVEEVSLVQKPSLKETKPPEQDILSSKKPAFAQKEPAAKRPAVRDDDKKIWTTEQRTLEKGILV